MARPPESTPASGDPGPESLAEVPQALADAPLAESRQAARRQWSLVWVIPLVTALIGGWVFAHSLWSKGPSITISFSNAEGLEAGKTRIKYREVDVGTVRNVAFDEKFNHVIVTADMTKGVAPLLVKDTRFWVVRPRVGASGISGLGTLLSGAYIGLDAGKDEESQREFEGLDKPPTVTSDLAGRRFNLRAENAGSLGIGSPVYFRRVQVGRVTSVELDPSGQGVQFQIFVDSPYESFVTRNARFWEASGVDITLDAGGFRVNTQSAAAILAGGIAFLPATSGGDVGAADAEASFRLAPDQASAMRETETETMLGRMYFSESLRGLSPGAPLDFRGVVIGEVRSIGVEFDRERRQFRFPVEVQVYPSRLWPKGGKIDDRDGDKILEALIKQGFRAQLRTGNLLTGQLYVALDFFPNAPKASVATDRDGVRVLPTIGGSLGEFQASISELLGKFNRIPFGEISADLRSTLQQTTSTLSTTQGTIAALQKALEDLGRDLPPELMNTLGELRQTMAGVRRTLDTAGASLAQDSALQTDLRESLRGVTRAAESLRQLTDYLERHPESLLRGKPEDPLP